MSKCSSTKKIYTYILSNMRIVKNPLMYKKCCEKKELFKMALKGAKSMYGRDW